MQVQPGTQLLQPGCTAPGASDELLSCRRTCTCRTRLRPRAPRAAATQSCWWPSCPPAQTGPAGRAALPAVQRVPNTSASAWPRGISQASGHAVGSSMHAHAGASAAVQVPTRHALTGPQMPQRTPVHSLTQPASSARPWESGTCPCSGGTRVDSRLRAGAAARSSCRVATAGSVCGGRQLSKRPRQHAVLVKRPSMAMLHVRF